MEYCLIEDDMVGGKREHDGVRITAERKLGARGDDGSGIAPHCSSTVVE